jgi:hypothetical protein
MAAYVSDSMGSMGSKTYGNRVWDPFGKPVLWEEFGKGLWGKYGISIYGKWSGKTFGTALEKSNFGTRVGARLGCYSPRTYGTWNFWENFWETLGSLWEGFGIFLFLLVLGGWNDVISMCLRVRFPPYCIVHYGGWTLAGLSWRRDTASRGCFPEICTAYSTCWTANAMHLLRS